MLGWSKKSLKNNPIFIVTNKNEMNDVFILYIDIINFIYRISK